MRVKLHSNEPAAADATDATLRALGFDTRLARDELGLIALDAEGLAEVNTLNPAYVKFALTRQGYVAEVRD